MSETKEKQVLRAILGPGFGEFYVLMSKGAEIIAVNFQAGQAVIYYTEIPEAEKVKRRIGVGQTGGLIPIEGVHVGTIQLEIEAAQPPGLVIPGLPANGNGLTTKAVSYVGIHVFDLGEMTDD